LRRGLIGSDLAPFADRQKITSGVNVCSLTILISRNKLNYRI
jgi:hypothetical protein